MAQGKRHLTKEMRLKGYEETNVLHKSENKIHAGPDTIQDGTEASLYPCSHQHMNTPRCALEHAPLTWVVGACG